MKQIGFFFSGLLALFLFSLGSLASPAAGLGRDVDYTPDVTYTLKTGVAQGAFVFIGASGELEGKINPDLQVAPGEVVQINLINGDGATHDVAIPHFDVDSDDISGQGAATTVVFRASERGRFAYFCTIPGHRAAGMEGILVVGEGKPVEKADTSTISRNPSDVPAPVGGRETRHVTVDLVTEERIARLADGVTYRYWTFDGRVPGPFLRLRVGDTATVNLHNPEDSINIHSVDLHAVNGPGGGASLTQVPPGETRGFTFKALSAGLFVYHCATPMVAHHIANGMYGLILVEPAGGLPAVDREFYVMQGEIYTREPYHTPGLNEFSLTAMQEERPTYYVFNGAEGALTKTHRLQAEVGDTVRIFFGVGGPNKASSLHLIGEIFDRVYREGDLLSPPARNLQTTTVPPGGAVMVEFRVDFPGRYILVDHALGRMERGLIGFLHVESEKDPAIFRPD